MIAAEQDFIIMPNCYSPLRYPGGKSSAVELLSPYLPKGRDLLSPFFGGGSIEHHSASRGARVFGYDTYGPIVCFFEQLKNNSEELLQKTLELYPLSDEKFHDIHANVHLYQDGPDKAAAIFALNYTTHMGLMQNGGSTRSQERFHPDMIRRKLNFDMRNVSVENLDFRESFKRHPDMFAFIDPPYKMKTHADEKLYGTNGSHHRDFNHEDLFNILKDRDRWIMTHEDHPFIREMYADFEIDEKTWTYTMSKRTGQELVIKSRDHAFTKPTVLFPRAEMCS